MTLGPILRRGAYVRYTPRNRDDHEWPSRWAELMNKRGAVTGSVMTRAGVTKVKVLWNGRRISEAIDPDLLDYVIAGDGDIAVGRRVRLLPTKEVGKTSTLTDWAGAVGVVVSPVKEAYVRVRWPDGSEQNLSVFALEPE